MAGFVSCGGDGAPGEGLAGSQCRQGLNQQGDRIFPEALLAAGILIEDKSLQGARLPEGTRHSWMGWNQVTVAGHSETESTEESGGSGRAAVTGGDPIAGPG